MTTKKYYLHSWENGHLKAVSVISKTTEEVVVDFTVGDITTGENVILNRWQARKIAKIYIKEVLKGELVK